LVADANGWRRSVLPIDDALQRLGAEGIADAMLQDALSNAWDRTGLMAL
jgi:hypothetical protein